MVRKQGFLLCGVVGDPTWDDSMNTGSLPTEGSQKESGGKLRRSLQKESFTASTTEKPLFLGKRDPHEIVFARLSPWEQDKMMDRAASGKEYDIVSAPE